MSSRPPCEPQLTDLLRGLKKLLYAWVLRYLYEQMPEEDRKRLNSSNFSNENARFQDMVIRQVEDDVEKRFDDIIKLSHTDQFFKGCELSGFPVEICDQGSYSARIASMVLYKMTKSDELRKTDPASPNFISLLRGYELLCSIFTLAGVGYVVHELNIRSDVLDIVNYAMCGDAIDLAGYFNAILQFDSFEFKLLQAQAVLHVALTEENPISLQNILTGFSMRLQQLEDFGVMFGVKLYPDQQKLLFNLVPLLSDVLDTHAWKSSSPRMMVRNFRAICTILYSFAKDIALPISAQQYGDMLELKFLETISSIPQQKDLSQKLDESLSGANPIH